MKKLSEVMKEQHREKGRFKPTVPRNVPNKVVATPKLDERCWTGYRQIGMKKKGDRMVPNCVQDSVEIPTDAPSIQSIAKKHGVSEEEIQKQLEMGIKVEKEHTSDIQAATEIALDHLNEKPDYYTRLKTIGEASAAAIAAATAISKKKSGNYDKKGFRKTPYKNPDHPKAKSNEQRRQEMNEEVGGKEEMQVQGSAALTLTSRPNKEPMKTYKDLKQITELSADLLHRYKEKAAADASAADKSGDYKRGDKRFSGVIRATHKQFDKFKKKGFSEEAEQIDEISAQAHKEYQAAARKDVASLAKHTGGEYGDIAKNIINRRIKGMTTSSALQSRDRLAKINKEEVEQINEMDEYEYHTSSAGYHGHPLNHITNKGSGSLSDHNTSYLKKAKNAHQMVHDDEKEEGDPDGVVKHAKKAVNDINAELKKRAVKEEVEQLEEKNVPTSPEKWARAKAMAKSKFDVYPSAYANGWAAKKYKEMGGGWKSVSESKETPPFEGGTKPKQKVVPGKYGAGYSTARHLARMAMKKQVEGMKKMPVKEETRKAAIVKEVLKKKKSDDAFQKDPEMSTTLTKV